MNSIHNIVTSVTLAATLSMPVQTLADELIIMSPTAGSKAQGVKSAEAEIEYIDNHTILIVDSSHSMKTDERNRVMKGYASALTSEQARLSFDAPTTHAISVIFFGQDTHSTDTYIVTDFEDAQSVAYDVFYDLKNDIPRSAPSSLNTGQTNIFRAFQLAQRIFQHEHENGFESLTKSVVISGDGVQKPDNIHQDLARTASIELSEHYGATVYGIPIIAPQKSRKSTHKLHKYYAEQVATPAGITDTRGYYVRHGAAFPSWSFEDFSDPVGRALLTSMF